jgi:hypothetical protein
MVSCRCDLVCRSVDVSILYVQVLISSARALFVKHCSPLHAQDAVCNIQNDTTDHRLSSPGLSTAGASRV